MGPRLVSAVLATALTLLLVGSKPVSAQTIRVSVSSSGVEANHVSATPAISENGQVIAFISMATNLVPDDTNAVIDVFVRDQLAGTTERVSVASDGTQGNSDSRLPSISADSRWVAFSSRASNLVPDDTNGAEDVFVHDRMTHTTRRISVGPFGEGNFWSSLARISADGRVVAFLSYASNLVEGDTNEITDVFTHDLTNGQIARISIGPQGQAVRSPGYLEAPGLPSLSADGRFVAFTSGAHLIEGDSAQCQSGGGIIPPTFYDCWDVYVHDRTSGQTDLYSDHRGGTLAQITADGELVTWALPQFNAFGTGGFPHYSEARWRWRYRRTGVTGTVSIGELFGQTSLLNVAMGPFTLSRDGRYLAFEAPIELSYPFPVVSWIHDFATSQTIRVDRSVGGAMPNGSTLGMVLNSDGQFAAFVSSASNLVLGDLNTFEDIFLVHVTDVDGDGITNEWEIAFALNPDDPADALTDPDGDGRTNLEEFLAKTHPRGDPTATRYFGEGATTDFFTTTFALVNPGGTDAVALLRFLTADQRLLTKIQAVPRYSRRTVAVADVPALSPAEFATSIEADRPLVIARTMTWAGGQGYGSHLERAVTAPATTWYFAEGATHSGFDLFYLLANASTTDADVRIRYLRPSGVPLEKTYRVAANSRLTVWVDVEQFGVSGEALADTDVSAVIDVLNGVPIIVERAMYRTVGSQLFGAGHASAGIVAPATQWFFGEGAIGGFFDTFLLLANPSPTPASVRATYLFPSGTTVSVNYLVPPESRFNIWVDLEAFSSFPVFSTAVSVTLESTNGVPIIAERAMWWPGPTSDTWYEAHVSAGATATAARWAIAAGEHHVDPSVDTYILIANTSAFDTVVDVTLLLETGARVTRGFTIAARSRFNILAHAAFPEALGQHFGALIESTETIPAQLVVEIAVYSSPGGVTWAAGGNALATPLP